MSLTVVQILNVNAAVKRMNIAPFLKGQPVRLTSVTGTPTVYAANHPGTDSASKYAVFKQTISGNKAFTLPTAVTAPTQTTGGAVASADQLKSVVLVNGVPVPHTRDDQVAAASSFCIGAGDGTAVGDTTIAVKGTTAANIAAGATSLSIADNTGANTHTILVGAKIAIAGDSTVYRATATSTALNGTTEVLLPITPPLQAAATIGALVTVTASDDRTILLATAPTVGSKVEYIDRSVSGDIVTLTGGAMTAGQTYEVAAYDFVTTSGNVDFQRLL